MGKQILNGVEYVTATTKGFPPLIYSNAEREVGVWTNGKPLYCKTIHISSFPNATTTNYPHNISDIDEIVLCFGGARNDSGTFFLMSHVNTIAVGNQICVNPNKTNISIATGTIDRSGLAGDITIYYTKTTDTAGSGKYSAVGDLMHHYSETEQVVGTWINGKPVYEKTINVGHNYGSPSSSVRALNYDILALNVKNVLSAYGFYVGDGSQLPYVNHTVEYSCYLFVTYSTIQIRRGQQLPYSDDSYVTIQYTKTTD